MTTTFKHMLVNFALGVLSVSTFLMVSAHAAKPTAREILLDQVTPQVGSEVAQAKKDAIAVSVLVESPDGTLTPRGVHQVFRTGERLRVKVLASRAGTISVYNTNPVGQTKHVWSGQVQVGQETVSPRMVLTGMSGVDELHIVLEPLQEPRGGVIVWLGNWLQSFKSGSGSSRDIQLDSQNTPQVSYLVNQTGQGVVSTVRVVHTR